jgi:hypothetical protein
MPKHQTHRFVDKLLLGKTYGEVHKALDHPYIILGRKHRCIFHSLPEAFLVGSLVSSDLRGGLVGMLHTWLDTKCSENKEFKRLIEFAVHQNAGRLLTSKKMRR